MSTIIMDRNSTGITSEGNSSSHYMEPGTSKSSSLETAGYSAEESPKYISADKDSGNEYRAKAYTTSPMSVHIAAMNKKIRSYAK